MGNGGIHYENPFTTPPEQRAPARRLRGRFAAGVTIWTSGSPDERTGLTVSSMIVADGDPPEVAGIIGDMSALWDAINDTEAFVVHVLDATQRPLADIFAGLRPSPGGPFASIEVEDSDYGPVLPAVRTRAGCRLLDARPAGYGQLVRGEVRDLELGDMSTPLVLFRGAYRRLEERPD